MKILLYYARYSFVITGDCGSSPQSHITKLYRARNNSVKKRNSVKKINLCHIKNKMFALFFYVYACSVCGICMLYDYLVTPSYRLDNTFP
jgi:hypothetical protein